MCLFKYIFKGTSIYNINNKLHQAEAEYLPTSKIPLNPKNVVKQFLPERNRKFQY